VLEYEDKISSAGAEVLIVAYDEKSLLQTKVLYGMKLPFPLVLDADKSCYRRWGMGRTNLFGAVLSPVLNWRYLKLLLRGERFLGTAPDMLQLGGDFVISPDGYGLVSPDVVYEG
jgi:AhpC/TSA antioxidant enzyme